MSTALLPLFERIDNIYNIITLDQSTKKTGWCIWENGKYKTSGLISLPSKLSLDDRMKEMRRQLLELITEYSVGAIYMEEVTYQKNAASMRSLAQLQGVLMGYCMANDIYVEIILPTEWRKYIGLSRVKGDTNKTLKQKSIDYVKNNFGIERDEDQCEAICIGAAIMEKYKDK